MNNKRLWTVVAAGLVLLTLSVGFVVVRRYASAQVGTPLRQNGTLRITTFGSHPIAGAKWISGVDVKPVGQEIEVSVRRLLEQPKRGIFLTAGEQVITSQKLPLGEVWEVEVNDAQKKVTYRAGEFEYVFDCSDPTRIILF